MTNSFIVVFDGLLDFIFGVFLIFKTPCFGVTFSTFRFFVFMFRLGLVMWDWVRSSMMRLGMVDRSMMGRSMVSTMMGRCMVGSMMDWMVGPLGIRGGGMMNGTMMGRSMVSTMMGRCMVGSMMDWMVGNWGIRGGGR